MHRIFANRSAAMNEARKFHNPPLDVRDDEDDDDALVKHNTGPQEGYVSIAPGLNGEILLDRRVRIKSDKQAFYEDGACNISSSHPRRVAVCKVEVWG